MNTILRTAPVRAAAPVAARRSVVARSGPGKVYTVEKVTAATVNGQDAAQIDDAINAIRFLAIDGINCANSGHPGLPMGCAPMSYALWNEEMNHNPANPKWANRDRFVLSAGHGSMLLYSLLHLTGYASVGLEDLKQFRQLDSCTPGHPENFMTEGIEVTTGPLGQGIANAVGLAMSEKHLAARFNKAGEAPLVDHYTYVIMGDGCNMEGISSEAASLAGHWGLGKLIALYDDNHISIDGNTEISFTEDVGARYAAMGWQVINVPEGNTDVDAIRAAIKEAKADTARPTLIKVTTLIGYGSPNRADTHDVHGAALGADETAATRANLKWEHAPFVVPDAVRSTFGYAKANGAAKNAEWDAVWAAYQKNHPAEAAEYQSITSGVLPAGWADALPSYTPEDAGIATRLHSQTMLNALAPVIPGFWGGSADLAPSNMTLMKMFGDFQKDSPAERNVRFGVREHAMGAICNGIALHSPGFVPYCATFFIFADYMRNPMRMSALSEARVIYVMTHDSIGLGEDGPTHQPIEHLASYRAMPNMLMYRPGDGNETAAAYKVAVENANRPTTIACSRQGMPNQPGSSIEKASKGGYVIQEASAAPKAIIIGTGSEVQMAIDAANTLEAEGIPTRVVSMPCTDVFDEQPASYRSDVLPAGVTARVSVEAASSFGWAKYIGTTGVHVGIDGFGASAPADKLYKKFGITAEAVVAGVKAQL